MEVMYFMLSKEDNGMKREAFYFDSRDNQSKIHAVRYEPTEGEIKGVVQIIHGMAEYFERYEGFASFLVERGYVVTGSDHLGHGRSVGKDKCYGYFCENDSATVVVRDVHRLKKITQQLYPEAPYFIVGHSMGSFVLRNYISRYGTGIDGAVIMGTGVQPPIVLAMGKMLTKLILLFKGPKYVSKFINRIAFGSYNKKISNLRTASDWLSLNEENVDRYNADPLCGFVFTTNGYLTLFNLIGGAQDKSKLENIPKALPILFVAGKEDPVGNYGKGVQQTYDTYKGLGITKIEIKLYENLRHEILNEKEADVVMEDIYQWIEKQ